MGYIVYRGRDGNAKSLSGTMYTNPTAGTRKLNVRTGSGADDVVKYGFTTDTSASEYCDLRFNIDGKKAYIGRSESCVTSRETTYESTSTRNSQYNVSTNTYSYNAYTRASDVTSTRYSTSSRKSDVTASRESNYTASSNTAKIYVSSRKYSSIGNVGTTRITNIYVNKGKNTYSGKNTTYYDISKSKSQTKSTSYVVGAGGGNASTAYVNAYLQDNSSYSIGRHSLVISSSTTYIKSSVVEVMSYSYSTVSNWLYIDVISSTFMESSISSSSYSTRSNYTTSTRSSGYTVSTRSSQYNLTNTSKYTVSTRSSQVTSNDRTSTATANRESTYTVKTYTESIETTSITNNLNI